MAKIGHKRAEWRGWKHRFPITVGIGKSGARFEVCVVTTSGRMGANTKKEINVCSQDRNPWRAFAKALALAASRIKQRSGVFAGMR